MPTTPSRPTAREKHRPANGPPIDEWEAALVGRQMVRASAAYTRGQKEVGKSLSVKGVRDAMIFCVQNAEGALARLPVEIIEEIEQILHDSVCNFRAQFSDC